MKRSNSAVLPILALVALGACSSSSNSATDAGVASDAGDGGGGAHVIGKITNAQSDGPVAGATVTAGGATTTSDANGAFSLTLPPNQPFDLSVTMKDFAGVLFQELSVSGDGNVEEVPMVPTSTFGALKNLMDGFDATKGFIAVQAIPTGNCKSEEGATVSVSPAGGSLIYFKGGLPSKTATAITAGESPSAVAYNLDPKTTYTLTITSPTCAPAPYPYVDGTLTYTGKIKVAADVVAEGQVFLK